MHRYTGMGLKLSQRINRWGMTLLYMSWAGAVGLWDLIQEEPLSDKNGQWIWSYSTCVFDFSWEHYRSMTARPSFYPGERLSCVSPTRFVSRWPYPPSDDAKH